MTTAVLREDKRANVIELRVDALLAPQLSDGEERILEARDAPNVGERHEDMLAADRLGYDRQVPDGGRECH